MTRADLKLVRDGWALRVEEGGLSLGCPCGATVRGSYVHAKTTQIVLPCACGRVWVARFQGAQFEVYFKWAAGGKGRFET